MAGVVEAVGAGVTEFKAGDEVFGDTGWRFGTHAEYVCMRASGRIAHKPHNLSFVEAAAVCNGAINALWCLSQRELHPGLRVLIYGASGSIGTAGVQIARHFGPHITAVCNTRNVELVRSLGADEVIDYLKEDFTRNGETYDIIFDAVGKLSFISCRRSLKPGGAYLPTDNIRNVLWAWWTARLGERKVLFPMPAYSKKELVFIKELIEDGRYRPVIDRCYPLEQVVEATRYVETQQKIGNVVITVTPIAEAEAAHVRMQTSAAGGACA
jgi:NADPH:quinone reductase-like Zn-dependent oxidoreductase